MSNLAYFIHFSKKITVFHELKCLLISGFAADALADEKGSGSTTTFEVLSHGD